MESQFDVNWSKIYEFLLKCGEIREPREFSSNLIKKIDGFIPYDQARIYFMNDNYKVYDEILFGVDKLWTSMYHEYYSKVQQGLYSPLGKSAKYVFHAKAENRVRDWTNCGNDEFITEYLRPQRLTYSLGLALHDTHNSAKVMVSLDRTSKMPYSKRELEILDLILPHLDNLFRNFYVPVPNLEDVSAINSTQEPLTAREDEIAGLLMKGASPASIAQKLCISSATVYKHISNIHRKLNVSSRQELLVKLMRE